MKKNVEIYKVFFSACFLIVYPKRPNLSASCICLIFNLEQFGLTSAKRREDNSITFTINKLLYGNDRSATASTIGSPEIGQQKMFHKDLAPGGGGGVK